MDGGEKEHGLNNQRVMMKIRANLLLLFVFNLSCNLSQIQKELSPQKLNENPDLTEYGFDEESRRSLDSLLQSFVDDKKLNAAATFVAKGGNVIYNKAVGWKDLENQTSASIDD